MGESCFPFAGTHHQTERRRCVEQREVHYEGATSGHPFRHRSETASHSKAFSNRAAAAQGCSSMPHQHGRFSVLMGLSTQSPRSSGNSKKVAGRKKCGTLCWSTPQVLSTLAGMAMLFRDAHGWAGTKEFSRSKSTA